MEDWQGYVAAVMKECRLCPRQCGADRTTGRGYCGASDAVKVALVSLHPWEEPCLTGSKGAGTVFFSYCNLRCCFCQNYQLSHEGQGKVISVPRLAEIFLEQQERGAATLDLVTPTHYVPQIKAALDMAREKGFKLPVVYNSNGYDTVETIKSLAGYVDIFLPDLKYSEEATGREYSGAADYFQAAASSIKAMEEVAGPVQLQPDGSMRSGVLVRHLVLPGHRRESMALLRWLWDSFGNDIYISLMSQYTPMYQATEHKKINRRLTTFEYQSVVDYASELGITQCFVQEKSSANTAYVPCFDGSGV